MKYQILDQISPQIFFYYRGQTKHTSYFSTCVSILTYLSLFTISGIFIYNFFYKPFPTAFYYNRYIKDTGIFYLNESSLFHLVTFTLESQYEPKAISVIGLTNVQSIPTLDALIIDTIDHYIYEECYEGNFSASIKEYYNSVRKMKNVTLCISKFYNSTSEEVMYSNDSRFTYPSLEHGASSSEQVYYAYYAISIMKCQNSPTNNIKDYLNNDYRYSVYFIDHNIDVQNYDSPLGMSMMEVSSQLSSSITSNNINLQPLNLKTRRGFMFDETEEINSYHYSQNEKLTYEKDKGELLTVTYFWMLNRQDVYDLTYQKIQDLAATIGGVSSFLFSFVQVMNFLYHDYILINDFNREMGGKNKKKKKDNNQDAASACTMSISCCKLKEKEVNSILNKYYCSKGGKQIPHENNMVNDKSAITILNKSSDNNQKIERTSSSGTPKYEQPTYISFWSVIK